MPEELVRREARAEAGDDGLMISLIKGIHLLLNSYRAERAGKALWRIVVWRVKEVILSLVREQARNVFVNRSEQSHMFKPHTSSGVIVNEGYSK